MSTFSKLRGRVNTDSNINDGTLSTVTKVEHHRKAGEPSRIHYSHTSTRTRSSIPYPLLAQEHTHALKHPVSTTRTRAHARAQASLINSVLLIFMWKRHKKRNDPSKRCGDQSRKPLVLRRHRTRIFPKYYKLLGSQNLYYCFEVIMYFFFLFSIVEIDNGGRKVM